MTGFTGDTAVTGACFTVYGFIPGLVMIIFFTWLVPAPPDVAGRRPGRPVPEPVFAFATPVPVVGRMAYVAPIVPRMKNNVRISVNLVPMRNHNPSDQVKRKCL
jgi:hypothetical protein